MSNSDNIIELFLEMNKETELSDFKTDYDKAEYLKKLLTNACTSDGPSNNEHYMYLRKYFLSKNDTKSKIPSWLRTNRNLDEFRSFIKEKFPTYAQRRSFIKEELHNLLEYLENSDDLPHADDVENELKTLNSEYVNSTWRKALSRKQDDPDGAITTSRTLIESVLKHILDDLEVDYPKDPDLHELYKMVANKLNLSPEQHYESIFKQILGSCSGIISGLGNLRNDLGDSHGKGKVVYKPSERHAELAVNLAGTMALFLTKTFENYKKEL